MSGMPCVNCGCSPPCSFADGELPNLAITGMHSYTGWSITGCCATMEFDYDTVQAYTKYDGGDVMSYDKTTTRVVEAFYYPETCGQVLQGWFKPANSSGEAESHYYPPEPDYTGCCPDPVVLNTNTRVDRVRGGQRFVLRLRPTRIKITIQKADIDCGGTVSQKYVVTSEKTYVGHYEYVDYQETSLSYTNSSSKPCWQVYSSFTVGTYPFSVSAWTPGLGAVATSISFCARKNLAALPDELFTFSSADDGSECSAPIPNCAPCNYREEVCYDTGPTGITEPSLNFCTVPVVATQTYTHTTLPHCRQHKWALFDRESGVPGILAGTFGSPPTNAGCLNFNPTAYTGLPACVKSFSYVGVSGAGLLTVTAFLIGSLADPNCDLIPSITCVNCYPGDATEDTDPGTTTFGPFLAGSAYARTVSYSIGLACSGYVRQTICVPFSSWTIGVV